MKDWCNEVLNCRWMNGWLRRFFPGASVRFAKYRIAPRVGTHAVRRRVLNSLRTTLGCAAGVRVYP